MAIFDFIRGSPKDRFATQVIKHLRAAGWPGDVEYDRTRFVLALFSPAQTVHLTNFYNDWLGATGANRDVVIDSAVAMALDFGMTESLEEAAANLLPAIRNRTELATLALEPAMEKAGEDYGRALRVMADHLAVMIAVDRPDSLAYLGGAKLDEWGRSFDELFEIALTNLTARSPCRFERHAGGFFVSAYNDDFDTSRLLVASIWGELPLDGAPVAIPISRDRLVVAGEHDHAALAAMAEFAKTGMNETLRPVSIAPIVRRNGVWQPYIAQGDELYGLRFLTVQQGMWDYEEQRIDLLGWLQRRNVDWAVAELEAYHDGTDLLTRTTWSQAGPALIPQADVVVLDDGKSIMVRWWKDVETVHGRFDLEGSYPPLFRAEKPLNSQAWERLRTEFHRPKGFPLQDVD